MYELFFTWKNYGFYHWLYVMFWLRRLELGGSLSLIYRKAEGQKSEFHMKQRE